MRILWTVLLLCIAFRPVPLHAETGRQHSVTGRIFYDENGDGRYEEKEPTAISGAYLKVYDNEGQRVRNPETMETLHANSADDGSFFFDGLKDGKYLLKCRRPDGFGAFSGSPEGRMDGQEYVVRVTVKDGRSAPVYIGLTSPEKNYFEKAEKEQTFFGRIGKWFAQWEWEPVWTSVKTAVTAIFFTFFLGLLSVRLVRSIRFRWLHVLIDGVMTLPMVLPPTVVGYFLLRLFGVNGFLGRFFLDFFSFRVVFSWESTVIAAVALSLPLMYKSTMGALEQVDENLIYAARTLGFSERKIFWKILVPNAIPGISSATILSFARGLGEYGATSMIAGNILGKTRTLPIAVAATTGAGQDDQAEFYVVLIVLLAMVLLTFMNYLTLRLSKRGVKS